MINRHESLETMKRYNIESLIQNDEVLNQIEDINDKVEVIKQFLSEHEESEEEEEIPSVKGNKTMH